MRWLVLLLVAAPAAADTLVATRTIRPATILAAEDVGIVDGETPGALSDPAAAIGLEARIILHAGRPIRPGDLGPPTIVERNQVVELAFQSGGLTIRTEGRALARGAAGDVIRVLTIGSRQTVSGRIRGDGVVDVGSRL